MYFFYRLSEFRNQPGRHQVRFAVAVDIAQRDEFDLFFFKTADYRLYRVMHFIHIPMFIDHGGTPPGRLKGRRIAGIRFN
jgi:hypothetical protein